MQRLNAAEIGSTWVYKVSCSWIAKNVRSLFLGPVGKEYQHKTWIGHPV